MKIINRNYKAVCIILSLALILTLSPITAAANGGYYHFDQGFNDVPATHWAFTDIMMLSFFGIINGFPDGTFRPEDAVTREQFARLVTDTFWWGQRDTEYIFDDVPLDRWSNRYITSAVRLGIIIPEEHGATLGADEPITRQEAAVWMVRALGVELGGGELTFYDSGDITFRYEIAAAVEIGLIHGLPGNISHPTARRRARKRQPLLCEC